jgi:hypothetical protein
MTPYREAAPRTKRPYVAPAIVAESGPWHGHAYVCPGCHAVGGERCAPGCIDAEIEREREDEQLYGPRDEEEDEASE